MVFVLTHIVLLAYGIVSHTSNLRPVMGSIPGISATTLAP